MNQLARLVDTVPGIRAVHDVPMPEGRGLFFRTLYPALWRFPPIKPFRGAYVLLEFD
ncbi:O-methyltransferase Omt domain protein [Mycobacterium ulcerans str. Harvey]|uniref:O-methyltransferase Omt domain protein n=1 Tax=Mycobacterium ulcerans str. Harvey TaxID=1299332 RepID=A0ABN0QVM5_MYCUL|nr:O-methyltransferase Omt domain protein [Mycobacterium ulcerans str. Harvey]